LNGQWGTWASGSGPREDDQKRKGIAKTVRGIDFPVFYSGGGPLAGASPRKGKRRT